VAIYVASADNYRQKYDNLRAERDSLDKKVQDYTKLSTEITSLKTENSELQTKFDNADRENAALVQKLDSWASITKDFQTTNDKQGQLLKNTLEELNKVQTEQVRQRKELDETTKALEEKMAIIETLQTENKRMQEERVELQNRLDKFLQPIGKTAAAAVSVTPREGTARPDITTETEERDIALQGLVTAVDLKNSLATISIGTADGVKEGMRFHVTRGNEFLCDILIIDVDAKEAVGAIELVQQQPNVGDTVSTNL
jgi:cell shape-determining protein MreC